jgi:hypothetical protein
VLSTGSRPLDHLDQSLAAGQAIARGAAHIRVSVPEPRSPQCFSILSFK